MRDYCRPAPNVGFTFSSLLRRHAASIPQPGHCSGRNTTRQPRQSFSPWRLSKTVVRPAVAVKSSALFVEMPGGIRIAVEQDFDGPHAAAAVARSAGSSAMFGLGAATHIYVATGATDMRLSFDGLYSLVIGQIRQSPQSGHLFLFANKRKTA